MANKHPVGTELGYSHEGVEHYAQVTEVHPEVYPEDHPQSGQPHPQAGEPKGIAVYDTVLDANGKVIGRNINHGTTAMKPAESPADRIVHGNYWKRV